MPSFRSSSKAPKNESVDTASSWYNDAPTESVVADLQGVNSASRKDKYRRWALYGAIGAAPLSLIFGIGGINATNQAKSEVSDLKAQVHKLENRPSGGAQLVNNSAGRYAAQQSLSSWLSSQPSPLPGGKLLYWVSSKSIPTKSKSDQRTIESFALTDGQGNGYTASLEVAIDPRGGATVMSGPSLESIPSAATDEWAPTSAWSGVDLSSDTPDSANGSIQNWANAYFGGNSQQLGIVVGDPNSSHTYQAMTGASGTSITVKAYATRPNNMAIAQVEITPKWNVSTSNTTGGGNPVVMDVLLKNANTAAPNVVAWGAPGSGPSLTAYQNATTIPSNAMASPTALPSASASTPAQPTANVETPTSKPTK